LTFHWLGKFLIDEVHGDVGGFGVGSSDGKVVDLAEKQNTVTVYITGVMAWFVDSWCETKFAKDFVCVFFLKSW
jgi:hypothetical protein